MFDKVLHRVKSRAPPEHVQKTVAVLERLGDGNISEKQLDEVAKNLASMKTTMFSAGDSDMSRNAAIMLTYEVDPSPPSPPLLTTKRIQNPTCTSHLRTL